MQARWKNAVVTTIKVENNTHIKVLPTLFRSAQGGSHLNITCCDCDQVFWYAKGARSFPSEALDCLISKCQRSNCSHTFLSVDFYSSSEVTLISPPMISWSSFDPGRKCFYTRHVSDYPLQLYNHICQPILPQVYCSCNWATPNWLIIFPPACISYA